MRNDRIRRGLAWLLAAALLVVAAAAEAQSFPSRPIQIIYPYVAGDSTDGILRMISPDMAKLLGQPVTVENRPGATGRLGPQALAKARGDGHIISFGSGAIMIALPLVDPTFKLELYKDYTPLAFLYSSPYVLAVHQSVGAKDMKSLIAQIKANPGKFNFGNTGAGGLNHLAAEILRQQAGLDFVHVPFKGTPLAFQALMAGDIQMTFTVGSFKSQMENSNGRVIPIATTGAQRWFGFPNLPTVRESAGLPNYEAVVWLFMASPPDVPRDVIAKLNSVFYTTLKQPAVAAKIKDNGNVQDFPTPEQMGAYIQHEIELLAPVVKKSGIKIDS